MGPLHAAAAAEREALEGLLAHASSRPLLCQAAEDASRRWPMAGGCDGDATRSLCEPLPASPRPWRWLRYLANDVRAAARAVDAGRARSAMRAVAAGADKDDEGKNGSSADVRRQPRRRRCGACAARGRRRRGPVDPPARRRSPCAWRRPMAGPRSWIFLLAAGADLRSIIEAVGCGDLSGWDLGALSDFERACGPARRRGERAARRDRRAAGRRHPRRRRGGRPPGHPLGPPPGPPAGGGSPGRAGRAGLSRSSRRTLAVPRAFPGTAAGEALVPLAGAGFPHRGPPSWITRPYDGNRDGRLPGARLSALRAVLDSPLYGVQGGRL